jgi:hypothetical protein
MTTWILIVFVHAGMLSHKDSMALTTVPGFKNQTQCETAGRTSEQLGRHNTKEVKRVCVRQD